MASANLHARSASRAVKAVKVPKSSIVSGQHADEDYKYLPSLCDEFCKLNEGSIAGIQTLDDDITFDRMHWVFAAQAKRCVRGGKIVFSFDAAFFKPESGFSGQLLNMSGIDCNGKCIPIAFAIVPVENTEAYRCWMELISTIVIEEVCGDDGKDREVTFGDLLNKSTTVIISDRGACADLVWS